MLDNNDEILAFLCHYKRPLNTYIFRLKAPSCLHFRLQEKLYMHNLELLYMMCTFLMGSTSHEMLGRHAAFSRDI